jgi:hypothetical protein
MIQITPQMRVLVAIEPVDGRKGIDSLAQLCQEKLAEDPFSGCVFVFRSRSGTAIRLLTYDGQGYWLAQKRLSKGRFRWCRRRNVRFLAYNSRFLILPWIKVKHLASHILGGIAARISRDWEALYRHPLYFLETFVDPQRFRGTCYYAANWVWLGETTGRGKASNSYVPNRSIKHVLGYPLHPRFRELLGALG